MKHKGLAVSKGIAVGRVFIFTPCSCDVKEAFISEGETEETTAKYIAARERAAAELDALAERLRDDEEQCLIMTAHKDILFDDIMDEEIRELIQRELYDGAFAIETVFEQYTAVLGKAGDPLIRERCADMRDVKNRLLRNWFGKPECSIAHLKEPCIVAAHELLPSDTAGLDKDRVLGIITEVGGATSHSAILARSYGIPAVLGVSGLLDFLEADELLILDALSSVVITDADEETIGEYERKRLEYRRQAELTQRYLSAEPITKDGVRINLGVNIGSSASLDAVPMNCCDLVGLFRTEFLYMENTHLPTEEEQFEAYKKVFLSCGDKPVFLRTLDIGGDKTLSYMQLPKEDNPFLGKRALRLCLSEPEIFRTQLRAALRASVFGKLWLMFPMVAGLDDLRRAKAAFESVRAELISEGKAVSGDIKLGVMIEIPSAALIADMIAAEADFASIGSNDLCQYLTATDRMNGEVSEYYQSYHPAMFRTMDYIIREFSRAGKTVCICGELGGDRIAAPVLVGMGMRSLSMNSVSLPEVKRVLSALTTEEMADMAKRVCSMGTASEIERYVDGILSSHGV